jgi:endonuclease YncB( thermonuclease family)
VLFRYSFTLDHVHDGDTIEGVLDMGLAHYLGRAPSPLVAIRFYGINAPELGKPGGDEARDYLMTLVQPGDVLVVDSMSWDKYQLRIDGIPYSTTGQDLCQAMLSSGHAVTYP